MPDLTRVFISYAWRDGAIVAEWLYRRFNALEGWSAWMDLELHADTLFSHELQRRLDDADLVVVVVSPNVNRRDNPSFVLKELQYATDPHVNKPVFAARAANCQLPLIIQGWTYTDFLAADRYETAFTALLEKIKSGKQPLRVETQRERELNYLRTIAREHGFWGKVYVEVAAQTPVKATPDPDKVIVMDLDVAAFLGEIALAVYTDKGHRPDDDPNAQQVENFAALSDALARFERAAIIGDPGCGKTTTLRRLAYDLGEKAALEAAAPLPLYVPLGGYDGSAFEHYLEQYFGGLRLYDYMPERVVLLLDGLNEIPYEHVRWVQTWLKDNPSVRVLLTCRKLDYVERKLELQRIDVLQLDVPRIRQFMLAYKLSEPDCDRLLWGLVRNPDLESLWSKWQEVGLTFEAFWQAEQPLTGNQYPFLYENDDERYAYNTMRDALQERETYPGLLGLVRNPFLLTIIIAIFHRTQTVPHNRAQLFAKFIQQLFDQRGKLAAVRQSIPWVDETVLHCALARLAYRMQADRKGTRVIVAWARLAVAEVAPSLDADRLLYLAASAGIIEKGAEIRFVHQLLQEYFAADDLAQDVLRGVPATRYFFSECWWETTGWEETVLLLAEMETMREAVVQWLTPVQPTLAYRCATEGETPCSEAVIHALLYPATEARRCPIACAEGGRRLAEQGDNRLGVGLQPNGVPDIVWGNSVPAGTYTIGGDEQVWYLLPEEQYTIQHAYQLARYPVTAQQFQSFLDAPDGFADKCWWDGLTEKYRKQSVYEQRFKYTNHPRENVSWYQAVAFCRWLTVKYREAGLLPAGCEIRLPTEQEWEIAARYPDGRKFPWGNEYVSGYANIDETEGNIGVYYLRQTTAVGLYPQGRQAELDLDDMAGNVWEWCLNEYDDPARTQIAGNEMRVLRGGSWGFSVRDARCASRFRDDPFVSNYFYGFRVVLGGYIR